MNVNDLTIAQAKEIAEIFRNPNSISNDNSHWEIGKPYLIRTVTMIDCGTLVAVTSQELVLEDAAWIADTGRFADALRKCQFNEVEPFPDGKVIINRGAVVDAVRIAEVTRVQK